MTTSSWARRSFGRGLANENADAPPTPDPALSDAVHRALHIGYERTLEQDGAFGFRPLVDIAVQPLHPPSTTLSRLLMPWATSPISAFASFTAN